MPKRNKLSHSVRAADKSQGARAGVLAARAPPERWATPRSGIAPPAMYSAMMCADGATEALPREQQSSAFECTLTHAGGCQQPGR